MRRVCGPQRHGDRGRAGEQRSGVVSRKSPGCWPSLGFTRHYNMGSGSSRAWPPTPVRPGSFPAGRDGTPGGPWRPASLLRMMALRRPLPIVCCHGIGTRLPVPDSRYSILSCSWKIHRIRIETSAEPALGSKKRSGFLRALWSGDRLGIRIAGCRVQSDSGRTANRSPDTTNSSTNQW